MAVFSDFGQQSEAMSGNHPRIDEFLDEIERRGDVVVQSVWQRTDKS